MTNAELLARLAGVARIRAREAVGRAAIASVVRWPVLALVPEIRRAMWTRPQSHLVCPAPGCGAASWRYDRPGMLGRMSLAELRRLQRKPTALYRCTHCGAGVVAEIAMVPS